MPPLRAAMPAARPGTLLSWCSSRVPSLLVIRLAFSPFIATPLPPTLLTFSSFFSLAQVPRCGTVLGFCWAARTSTTTAV